MSVTAEIAQRKMSDEELARREAETSLRLRAEQARGEYPHTKAAFARVRESAMRNMFGTLPNEHEKREELYRLVHILNVVETELLSVCGQGQDAIDEWLSRLATQPATTGNTPLA